MVSTNTARIAFGSTAAVLALFAGSAQADERDSTFSIDIAADCNRFITEGTPHPANPGFGDYFMQEGIIYRPGTAVQGLRLTRWE